MFSPAKKTKKLFSLLMAIVLSFAVAVPALAAPEAAIPALGGGIMMPMWDNTAVLNVGLSFSGTKAICGAVVIGEEGVTQITGSGVLARRNSDGTYTTVKTWSGLVANDDYLGFDGSYYVTSGYTYRFTFMAIVIKDGVGEYVSGYHEAYCG